MLHLHDLLPPDTATQVLTRLRTLAPDVVPAVTGAVPLALNFALPQDAWDRRGAALIDGTRCPTPWIAPWLCIDDPVLLQRLQACDTTGVTDWSVPDPRRTCVVAGVVDRRPLEVLMTFRATLPPSDLPAATKLLYVTPEDKCALSLAAWMSPAHQAAREAEHTHPLSHYLGVPEYGLCSAHHDKYWRSPQRLSPPAAAAWRSTTPCSDPYTDTLVLNDLDRSHALSRHLAYGRHMPHTPQDLTLPVALSHFRSLPSRSGDGHVLTGGVWGQLFGGLVSLPRVHLVLAALHQRPLVAPNTQSPVALRVGDKPTQSITPGVAQAFTLATLWLLWQPFQWLWLRAHYNALRAAHEAPWNFAAFINFFLGAPHQSPFPTHSLASHLDGPQLESDHGTLYFYALTELRTKGRVAPLVRLLHHMGVQDLTAEGLIQGLTDVADVLGAVLEASPDDPGEQPWQETPVRALDPLTLAAHHADLYALTPLPTLPTEPLLAALHVRRHQLPPALQPHALELVHPVLTDNVVATCFPARHARLLGLLRGKPRPWHPTDRLAFLVELLCPNTARPWVTAVTEVHTLVQPLPAGLPIDPVLACLQHPTWQAPPPSPAWFRPRWQRWLLLPWCRVFVSRMRFTAMFRARQQQSHADELRFADAWFTHCPARSPEQQRAWIDGADCSLPDPSPLSDDALIAGECVDADVPGLDGPDVLEIHPAQLPALLDWLATFEPAFAQLCLHQLIPCPRALPLDELQLRFPGLFTDEAITLSSCQLQFHVLPHRVSSLHPDAFAGVGIHWECAAQPLPPAEQWTRVDRIDFQGRTLCLPPPPVPSPYWGAECTWMRHLAVEPAVHFMRNVRTFSALQPTSIALYQPETQNREWQQRQHALHQLQPPPPQALAQISSTPPALVLPDMDLD